MAMIVTCPCGRQLRLDEQFVGKMVRCPICQQTFVAAGSEGGHFPIENPAPPSEASSPRLREAPANRPPRASEPGTYDLAPPYESEPPRPDSRARPRSRSVIREVEDAEEVEPEEINRTRRKSRRPSDSRGKPCPGSWQITRYLDICAAVMMIGGISLIFTSIQNMRLASISSATPRQITLAQLLANGPGGNAHVLITDFVPAQNYVYLFQRGKYEVVHPQDAEKRRWTEVWVPIVPLTQEMKNRMNAGGNIEDLLRPNSVRAVVRLSGAHDKSEVEHWYENKLQLQGMVVNLTESLSLDTSNLLNRVIQAAIFRPVLSSTKAASQLVPA